MRASEKLKRKNARNGKKQYALNILLVVILVFALLFTGAYGGMRKVTDNDVFASGTVVDGFEVGGQTLM